MGLAYGTAISGKERFFHHPCGEILRSLAIDANIICGVPWTLRANGEESIHFLMELVSGGGRNKTSLSKRIPKWDGVDSASLLVYFSLIVVSDGEAGGEYAFT